MKNVIGFATEYYTLWEYSQREVYTTDNYGNHHVSGVDHVYRYVKNISIDIEKVKTKYPNVEIDETLRGKINSFSYNERVNLPTDFFWFGKHNGKKIDEVINTDFNYCLWVVENRSCEASKYIQSHPEYVDYIAELEAEKLEALSNITSIKSGDNIHLEFVKNGYNADDDGCWSEATYGDIDVFVKCKDYKLVNGMYPYIMPIVSGKAMRVKNKTVAVRVISAREVQIDTDRYGNEIYKQYIEID